MRSKVKEKMKTIMMFSYKKLKKKIVVIKKVKKKLIKKIISIN